jgi:hypothetical protein
MIRDLREKGIRKNVELSKFITNYYVQTQTALKKESKPKAEQPAEPEQA